MKCVCNHKDGGGLFQKGTTTAATAHRVPIAAGPGAGSKLPQNRAYPIANMEASRPFSGPRKSSQTSAQTVLRPAPRNYTVHCARHNFQRAPASRVAAVPAVLGDLTAARWFERGAAGTAGDWLKRGGGGAAAAAAAAAAATAAGTLWQLAF